LVSVTQFLLSQVQTSTLVFGDAGCWSGGFQVRCRSAGQPWLRRLFHGSLQMRLPPSLRFLQGWAAMLPMHDLSFRIRGSS